MKPRDRLVQRFLSASAFLLLLTTCATRAIQGSSSVNTHQDDETIEVCAGQSVPGSYVKTDSYFDSARCDGARIAERFDAAGIEPPGNVWLFERYTNLPRGSELEVCTGAAIPDGWVKTDNYFDIGRCDGGFIADRYDAAEKEPPANIVVIRRVR